MMKKTTYLNKLKYISKATYVESLFLLYVAYILVTSAINDNGYFNVPPSKWLSTFAISFLLATLIIFLAYRKLGPHDYRFKAIPHIFVIAYTAVVLAMSVTKTDILVPLLRSIGSTEFSELLASAILTYLVLSIPAVSFVTAAIYNLFSISDPYIKAFNETRTVVEKGNFSARIEDPNILNDSVFGPIAVFFNEIISTASELIEKIVTSSSVLIQASEKIVDLSEQLNEASDAINTSTEALSRGAQDQVESVLTVSDEMLELTRLVDDVTSDIKNNAVTATRMARQMLILSLNASIEAARNGSENKTFHVVANHIRQLANSSRETAGKIAEISELIAERLHSTFNTVKENVDSISAVAEENAASVEEISASMQDLTANMQQLVDTARILSSKAEESKEVLSKVRFVPTNVLVN